MKQTFLSIVPCATSLLAGVLSVMLSREGPSEVCSPEPPICKRTTKVSRSTYDRNN